MPGKVRALAALPLVLLLAAPAWGYGRLDLEAHPKSARVWVDGAPAGGVPTRIELTAGKHAVKVTAPGRRAAHFRVQVQNGKSTTHRLTLAPYGRTKVTPRPRPVYHPPVKVAVKPPTRPTPPRPVPRAVPRAPQAPPTVVAAAPMAKAPILDVEALPLPAPAILAPEPLDRAALAPPPEPTPAVPAPPVPAPAPMAASHATSLLGLDGRAWADLGWLTILGSIVGALVGLVVQGWPGTATWHDRRPRRGVVVPASEADAAPADAWAALMAEDWAQAARLLWQCRPASPWVYYHLGLAYEHLGHDLEAEAAYRTAVAADPAFAAAGYNLGVLLDRLGLAPQAAIAYRRLLESCPTDVDALFNLGHLCRELGLPQQAEVHWTVARAMAPKDEGVADNLKLLVRERRAKPLSGIPALRGIAASVP